MFVMQTCIAPVEYVVLSSPREVADMTRRSRTALLAAALSVAGPGLPNAQQQMLEPLQTLVRPVPPGPYVSWPKQDREPVVRWLFRTCMTNTASSFGRGYQGPAGEHQVDAYQEYWQAQIFACAVRKMPSDWPLLA